MAKLAIWEFEDQAVFDGESTFAEVSPPLERSLRSGTLEITFRPYTIHRATVLTNGVPMRTEGAFCIVVTHDGAVSLSLSSSAGDPVRLQTAAGFVSPGERVQATLSWGKTARFTVVNCSRLKFDAANPEAGYLTTIPLRAVLHLTPKQKITFGSATEGIAPYFHGKLIRASLSDTIDAPTVAPPAAKVVDISMASRGNVIPRRVAPAREMSRRDQAVERLSEAGRGRSPFHIATAKGERPLSEIRGGDEILTRANGMQVVRWVGRVMLDWNDLRDRPHLKPIVFPKGALGHGLPEDDTYLPPHHRLVVSKRDLTRIAETQQILSSARSLSGGHGVHEANAMNVVYTHLQFDRTQLILVNGIWVEAFNPFDDMRGAVFDAQREELFDLFPGLSTLSDRKVPAENEPG